MKPRGGTGKRSGRPRNIEGSNPSEVFTIEDAIQRTIDSLTEHLAVIEFVQVTRGDAGADPGAFVMWEQGIQ